MRFALTLLALFAIAVAVALVAGNNQGTVTLFWPPYRVDLSVNFVMVVLAGAFVTLHLALRALSLLFGMPSEARRWRIQHRERAMFVALLDSLSHFVAGRFIRARKSGEMVLLQESALHRGGEKPAYGDQLRAVSHLLVAESAHSLQNRQDREVHFQLALSQSEKSTAQEVMEGVKLRAARWAVEERDPVTSLRWLDELPQGASRRTVALRLRLKAARLGGQTAGALETARLLAKHRAFSVSAGESIVRGLTLEMLNGAQDAAQLQKFWENLENSDQTHADIALAAVKKLLSLGGDVGLSRSWLVAVWDQMIQTPSGLTEPQRVKLIEALQQGYGLVQGTPDAAWLTRIETAQMRNPGDPKLQYLAGITCLNLKLWGKAQQLLAQSVSQLRGSPLEQNAWLELATLAEQRGDADGANQAYKKALISVARS